jgi:motility quorum-sensing regulator / GCU-specific mRNA interferase toxin
MLKRLVYRRMEKMTAHYPLADILAIVSNPESVVFTRLALRGGAELGLDLEDMRAVVMSLVAKNFYKSMTTLHDHRLWQDVYHGVTSDGVVVYIKITGYTDGTPPIIQFKRK